MGRSAEMKSRGTVADHLLGSDVRGATLYALKKTLGTEVYQQVTDILQERVLEINEADVAGTLEDIRQAPRNRRITRKSHD